MGISLSLVVRTKNEEKNIKRCIESVKNIVDEIIILDHDSEDNTIEISRTCGALVFPAKESKKFSDCNLMNEAIQYATKDYILILDADEIIDYEDTKKIKRYIENNKYVFGFYLDKYNYVGNGNFFITRLIRIIKNFEGFKFYGNIFCNVEEDILNKGKKTEFSKIKIHHFGFLRSYKNYIYPKYIKYEKMVTNQVEKYNYSINKQIKDIMYLIVSKMILGKYKEADNYCNDFIINFGENSEILFLKANIFVELKKFKEAHNIYQKAIYLSSYQIMTIELINREGILYYLEGDIQKSIQLFLDCIEIDTCYYPALLNLRKIYTEIKNVMAAYYNNRILEEAPFFIKGKIYNEYDWRKYTSLIDTI